jgi:chorismate mutase-like protein
MNIEDWRARIDEIDRKLVELLNDRTRCAIEIAKIKRTKNIQVFDPERERQVIRNVQGQNQGPLDNEGLQRLFERVIDECRRLEHRLSDTGVQ